MYLFDEYTTPSTHLFKNIKLEAILTFGKYYYKIYNIKICGALLSDNLNLLLLFI